MSHRVPVETTDMLEQTLSSLESTEALVLRLRTGLVDGRRHTLREVGEFLGTTRSEARTLEWSGWRKLARMASSSTASRDVVQSLLRRCTRPVMVRPLN